MPQGRGRPGSVVGDVDDGNGDGAEAGFGEFAALLEMFGGRRKAVELLRLPLDRDSEHGGVERDQVAVLTPLA